MLAVTADKKRWGSWHVGETLRLPPGRVLTFQADGHELEALLDALEKAGVHIESNCLYLTPVL